MMRATHATLLIFVLNVCSRVQVPVHTISKILFLNFLLKNRINEVRVPCFFITARFRAIVMSEYRQTVLLLSYLQDHPLSSAVSLAAHFGVNPTSVNRRLYALFSIGFVLRKPDSPPLWTCHPHLPGLMTSVEHQSSEHLARLERL